MTAPRLIVLARHGQSEHHVRRMTGGWTDTPLTALGHEQSRRLAARLRSELGETPVAVYTSDLQRAAQTAAHVAAAFGVTAIVDARLREHNNGAAANMTIEEARAAFPGAQSPWLIDDHPYPECESGRELFERAAGFLDDLEDDGRVPVVLSHGGTIEVMVARWLMLTPETWEPINLGMHTTGVTTLSRGMWGRAMVERMNDTAHLAGMEGWVGIGELLGR
jgi:probable phosphoglycerate mutase